MWILQEYNNVFKQQNQTTLRVKIKIKYDYKQETKKMNLKKKEESLSGEDQKVFQKN